ncbi:MAG: hypothetical protein AB1478_09185 [Nitrospirota bacterium]
MQEWIIKLGPVERTNHSEKKDFAERGALAQVKESVGEIMEKAKSLIPLLEKGFTAPSGYGAPEVKEDPPEYEVMSYELPDGSWFSIVNSGTFGYKLECKRV